MMEDHISTIHREILELFYVAAQAPFNKTTFKRWEGLMRQLLEDLDEEYTKCKEK